MAEHKISFKNDYSEGAHPEILAAINKLNEGQQKGYGYDDYSLKSSDLIRKEIDHNASIYYVSGGTQANLLVISHLLRPYESVVAANSSHIEEHETGAIEATGHKINLIPHQDGKITIEGIEKIKALHIDEHMVLPRLVFISLSTEVGTVYTLEELRSLSEYCRAAGMFLYVDGARLAMALASEHCDWTLADLAGLVDVLYIGGTKNGALFGEAIVFCKEGLAEGFLHHRKQKGALIAKGRALGIQFLAFFESGLYYRLGKHAVKMCHKIYARLLEMNVDFKYPVHTNQLFPILSNDKISLLEECFSFHVWEKYDDDHSVIRLVTSWATSEEQVERLLQKFAE